jgi:hypothetical protein
MILFNNQSFTKRFLRETDCLDDFDVFIGEKVLFFNRRLNLRRLRRRHHEPISFAFDL